MIQERDKFVNKLSSALRPVATALVLLACSPIAAGYSNDAFECYVAVYSVMGEKPTLVNPALRVGLHPQGNDPVIHIYGDELSILPLKSVTISDRFIRGRIHSAHKPVELGGLLLRQRGLELTFNLTEFKRGTQERVSDLSFKGECSSVGYQSD